MALVTRTLVSGIFALGLAACVPSTSNNDAATTPGKPAPADEAPPSAANDKCKASLVADMVGQPYNEATLEKIKATVGHVNIRPIRPNQPVTMDFREDRLNIDIDRNEKIVKFHCN